MPVNRQSTVQVTISGSGMWIKWSENVTPTKASEVNNKICEQQTGLK